MAFAHEFWTVLLPVIQSLTASETSTAIPQRSQGKETKVKETDNFHI